MLRHFELQEHVLDIDRQTHYHCENLILKKGELSCCLYLFLRVFILTGRLKFFLLFPYNLYVFIYLKGVQSVYLYPIGVNMRAFLGGRNEMPTPI